MKEFKNGQDVEVRENTQSEWNIVKYLAYDTTRTYHVVDTGDIYYGYNDLNIREIEKGNTDLCTNCHKSNKNLQQFVSKFMNAQNEIGLLGKEIKDLKEECKNQSKKLNEISELSNPF